jgi:hypothetical protein
MKLNVYVWLNVLLICGICFSCDQNERGDSSLNSQLQLTDSTPGAANIFIDSSDARRYIGNFERLYRKGDSSISKSVWISKDAVKEIYKYLDSNHLRLDGLRIYMAAYDETMEYPVAGRQKTHQTTVMIVPTEYFGGAHSDSSKHRDRWNVFPRSLIDKHRNAANHGELCPTKCNDSTYVP